MEIKEAPRKLIDEDGRPRLGIFSAPIPELNAEDFRPPGGERLVRKSRIKRWEYLGIAGEEVVAGAAIVSLHLAGNVFFYVFDRRERRLAEYGFTLPFCRGMRFASNGKGGRVSFERGSSRVVMENDRPAGRHRLELRRGEIVLQAEFADRQEPLVCVTRAGFAGFNYTLKLAGLQVKGELVWAGKRYELTPERDFGVLDYTTGCLARETFWNWAAGAGKDAAGNIVGINFVQGVNETGFTENAFWIGDRLVKVDTVNFIYDDRRHFIPWKITSWDGKVDLEFFPEGGRRQNLNLGLLASRFHQPFGRFTGALRDESGALHSVALSGFTEEHYAKW